MWCANNTVPLSSKKAKILLKDLPELDFISYNIIEQTAKVQMALHASACERRNCLL